MPTQTTNIFNAATPGIQYAGAGITWTIAKNVSVGSGTSFGVYSTFANSKLVNKGTVYSNTSVGAFFTQGDTEVVNKKSGQISGSGYGLVVGGGAASSNAKVTNDGDILSTAGFGLVSQNVSNFQLYNTGDIFGPSVALYLISSAALAKGTKTDNSGFIHSPAYAIVISTPGMNNKIVNREDGVIEGDTGALYAGAGMIDIKNEGKIKGAIFSVTSDANDKVINKAKIAGDVHLGPGNDTFKNKDGKAKMLFGENGNDLFVAGSTKNQIVFNTTLNALTNVDTVKNFEPGKDQFYLDMTVFASLTGPGPLLASEFRKGSAAVDADDFIVYHKGSGSLFYDPDGSGGATQTKFADVDNGTKLSHHDFTVIA